MEGGGLKAELFLFHLFLFYSIVGKNRKKIKGKDSHVKIRMYMIQVIVLSEMWPSDVKVCIVHYVLEQSGLESLPAPAENHTSRVLKSKFLTITQL